MLSKGSLQRSLVLHVRELVSEVQVKLGTSRTHMAQPVHFG